MRLGMRAMSGWIARDPLPPPPTSFGPYPETFGKRIFQGVVEADTANAHSAKLIIQLREDLENAMDDINVMRRKKMDLRKE